MNKTYNIFEYIVVFIIILIIYKTINANIIKYEHFDSQLIINYIQLNLSKDKKNLIIIPHSELGDAFIMNGAIRYLANIYDKIIYVCRKNYYDQIAFMFSDNKNILIYSSNLDVEIYSEINKYIILNESTINIFNTYNIDFIPMKSYKKLYKPYILSDIDISYEINESLENYPNFMYDELKLDPEIRYTYFKMTRNLNREIELYNNLINILGNQYIIIIDDRARNYTIDNKYIENKNLPIFYLGNNSLNTDSRLNEIQDKYISNYVKILEHATEVHTIESSIYVLLDLLNITNNIHVHAYVRNGNIDKRLNAITKNKNFKYIYTN